MINPTTLGIIIDAVIILIFIINMTVGYFKGFIKTVFGFLTFLGPLVISYIFAKPLANLFKTTSVYNSIFDGLENTLTGYFENITQGQLEKMITEGSAETVSVFERFGRSFSDITAEYTRLAAEKGADVMEGLVSYIIEPACDAIITAICFILLFIVSFIALKIVAAVLDLAAKLPIIRTCNRVLGLAAGALIAFVHVIILTIVIDAVLPYFDTSSVGITVTTIRNSCLYSWFASLNPVGAVFSKN